MVVAGPVIWVAVEYMRSNFFFLAFPWVLAGHSQHASLSLIQVADITGVLGVSFLIVMVNSAVARAFIFWRYREGSLRNVAVSAGTAVVLAALALGYGAHRISAYSPREGPRILVVQGNVPQDLKEQSFKELETLGEQMKQDHIALTARVFKEPADLIIWPETMWPGFLFTDPAGFAQISALSAQTGAHILIGTQSYVFDEGSQRRNSAVVITPEGRADPNIYDKMFLVPISEYIPLESGLPVVKFIVSQMLPYESESLTHGTRLHVFEVAGSKFSVNICFELSIDSLCREARLAGAEYLVNISNDGWFTDSAELDLALGQGVFRAIENRMGVVRSVNTGISCFIDPLGRVELLEVDGRRKRVSGTLHRRVALSAGETVFTAWGNWFGFVNLLAALAVTLHAIWAFAKSKLATPVKIRENFS